MKEVEKNESKLLSDCLDGYRHQQADVVGRKPQTNMPSWKKRKPRREAEIARLKFIAKKTE